MRNRWFAVTTLVLFTVAILAASAAFAFAAPPNDNFSAAIGLTPAAAGLAVGSNVAATLETSEVHPADNDGSIWYTWVPIADDIVSFDTTGSVDDVGDPTAVDVNVYTGAAANSVVEVPESFVPRAGRVEIPAKAGTTYRISLTCPGLAARGTTHLAWQTQGNTGHITGTVTATSGGAAIAGIQVDAYAVGGAGNSLRTVLTNGSGFYDLTGLGTGNYQVGFTDPAPTTYISEWYDNKLTQGSSTTIAVVNGATTSGRNAVLDRASSISGNVKSNGVNTANVTVQLLPYTGGVYDGAASVSALTDTSGNYSFTALYPKIGAGNYYIVQFVEPSGSGYSTQFYNQKSNIALAAKLQPVEGTALAGINCLWPTADTGTLNGTVTSGGSPLAGVAVSVAGAGSTTTAANGTYTIGNITPGTRSVTYSKPGYASQTFDNVVIDTGVTTTKNVSLVALPGTLSGTVTASGGGALAGVSVTVSGGAGSATTAADGTYTIANIPPGTYSVTYSLAGYTSQTPSGIVITGNATTTRNVSLVRLPGTLSGTVTAYGGALAGVTVTVSGGAGSTTTAANGTYTVANIPAGTYSVTYSKAAYADQTFNGVAIATNATTTQNVSMVARPAGTLSGKVTASGGSPLSGVTVSVTGTPTVTTDVNGDYAVLGVVEGPISVTYSRSGYAGKTITTLTITANATTTQDVTLAVASAPVNVWRFRYTAAVGNYLWTADPGECETIKATLASTWAYEGTAYSFNSANPANKDTMWRFKNKSMWSYFYSADPAEVAAVRADPNSIWQYEGPTSIKIARTTPTLSPVWRFRCLKNPTYLWTADPSEKNTIDNTLKSDYQLEGIAYYLGK